MNNIMLIIPHITVLVVFVVSALISWFRYKRLNKYMKLEAEKARIFRELVEIEHDYRILIDEGKLRNCKNIVKSLNEVSSIIKSVGFAVNLDKIHVIPAVKDKEEMEKFKEVLNEEQRAPEDVRALLKRKIQVVNDIAQVKHPATYCWNKVLIKMQIKGLQILVQVLLGILWVLARLHKSTDEENEITNMYPVYIESTDSIAA